MLPDNDPLVVLGKSFASVESQLSHEGIANVFEEVEEGEENEQFVKAQDGSWELLLDSARVIKTIFLYADKGCKLPEGLRARMTPQEVQRLLGRPTRSGEESVQPILGPKGSWNRYDRPTHALHLEYTCGEPLLRMVTLMLSKGSDS